jgi:hypothetical protein
VAPLLGFRFAPGLSPPPQNGCLLRSFPAHQLEGYRLGCLSPRYQDSNSLAVCSVPHGPPMPQEPHTCPSLSDTSLSHETLSRRRERADLRPGSLARNQPEKEGFQAAGKQSDRSLRARQGCVFLDTRRSHDRRSPKHRPKPQRRLPNRPSFNTYQVA